MGIIGLLRISTYTKGIQASKKIDEGNLLGEGRILGGTLFSSSLL